MTRKPAWNYFFFKNDIIKVEQVRNVGCCFFASFCSTFRNCIYFDKNSDIFFFENEILSPSLRKENESIHNIFLRLVVLRTITLKYNIITPSEKCFLFSHVVTGVEEVRGDGRV